MIALPFAKLDVAVDEQVRKHRHLHKGFMERAVNRNLGWLLSTYFQAQGIKLHNKLEESRDFEKAWAETVAETSHSADAIALLLSSAYKGGAAAVAADLGLRTPPLLPDFGQERADLLLHLLNDVTRKKLKAIFTNALKEAGQWENADGTKDTTFEIPGLDPSQWSDAQQAVQAQFDDFLSSRANTVSRNEAAVAYERGGKAVIDQLTQQGQLFEKAWDGDADLCEEICAPNVEQDWIPMDEAFESGDDSPPAHPNCGCTCLYQEIEQPTTEGDTTDPMGSDFWGQANPDDTSWAKEYTNIDADIVNTQLRRGVDMTTDSTVSALDRLLATTATAQDMTVERLLTGNAARTMFDKGFEESIGDTIKDAGYMSTTLPGGIYPLGVDQGGAKMIINVPAGSQGLHLAPISKFPDEKEFLLPRGSSLRIIDAYPNAAGFPTIVAELVFE